MVIEWTVVGLYVFCFLVLTNFSNGFVGKKMGDMLGVFMWRLNRFCAFQAVLCC